MKLARQLARGLKVKRQDEGGILSFDFFILHENPEKSESISLQ
jgi:hypothetical protein